MYKRSLIAGILTALFMYLVLSMYSHTWDILALKEEGVIWASLLTLVAFVVPLFIGYLDGDK